MSTENPKLITIILHIAIFIESYLSLNLFLYILNIKSSRKQRVLYVLISSIIGTLSSYFIPSPFNFIVNYISVFFIILIIFKLSPIKVILCMFLPLVVFALTGSLISNPYLTLLNITYEQFQSIPIYKLGYFILLYSLISLIILIIKIIKIKKLNLTILEDFDKNTKLIIFLNFIFGFLFYVFNYS